MWFDTIMVVTTAAFTVFCFVAAVLVCWAFVYAAAAVSLGVPLDLSVLDQLTSIFFWLAGV